MDKNTLLQLRGTSAKGYAFDRRYDQEAISDNVYDDCIMQLVEKVFKVSSDAKRCCLHGGVAEFDRHALMQGYNGTVMAYGQTGSGKTHTVCAITPFCSLLLR